jgi:hypothetical protein
MEEILKAGDESALVVISNGIQMNVTGATAKPKTTTPIKKDLDVKEYASWYEENNLFPERVLDALKRDPELYSFIDSYVKSLYSGGIVYGTWTVENGERTFQRIFDESIEQWLEDSNIAHYLQEAFIDGKTFYNAWAELAFDIRGNNGKGYITQLSIQDAVFCRFGKQNPKTGIKDKTFVSADWAKGTEQRISYHTIDPYFKPLQQVIDSRQSIVYFPLVFPGLPGNIYYQMAPWHGLIKSNILELSRLMIDFKLNFLKNGMTIKYHVEVSKKYFIAKYKEKWEQGSDKERIEIMRQEIESFNDVVTGIENSGKTFMTILEEDPRLGGNYSTWKITPIKNETASGEYTNDMNQNSLIKLRGLDYDPAIPGGFSAGGMNGSGGSDARVAYNIHQIKNKPMQDVVMAPLNKVIKHVNGWEKKHPGLTFMTESLFLATMDQTTPKDRL